MSNKTPKETAAATGSEHSTTLSKGGKKQNRVKASKKQAAKSRMPAPRHFVMALAFLLILSALLAVWGRYAADSQTAHCREDFRQDTVIGLPNGKDLSVQIADDPASQAAGLSGRNCLPDGFGMFFSFDSADIRCFWMKDMLFNIDMVWLDADHNVVHSVANAPPASYPAQFCPPHPAQYVLEIPAGKAAEYGLVIGSKIEF